MTPLVRALAIVAVAAAAHAGNGTLKGTVTAGIAEPRPLAGAVVLVDAPPAAGTAHVVIDQRDQTFVPHVVVVPVGGTVEFLNSDPYLHNVASSSPAKTFDLGMFGQGERRSVTFDQPGIVRVGCAVHPKMAAVVVVHANPWAAVTDDAGRYTIAGIPAGRYPVRVWHEDYREQRATAAVYDDQVQALDVKLGARR
jgi:plastocyanin